MLKRHLEFVITTYERDAWLENMYKAIQQADFSAGVGIIYMNDYV